MPSISFPFRFNAAARLPADAPYPGAPVAINGDGSDEEANEAVALHVMTHPLERPMRPEFGTESLPFGPGLNAGALQLQLAENGWDYILIRNIDTTVLDRSRVQSVVAWERKL